jgi:hypothetical protein
MYTASTSGCCRTLLTFGLIAVSAAMLWGCGGGGGGGSPDQAIPLTVPKASCGPNDTPETALQGQVPAALRATGFKGFSCNLQLLGQSKGDGANWQHTWFADGAGHKCAFHGTAFTTANRTHLGVAVVDVTVPTNPTETAYLTTTSMLDPWESLKVNERRQLLSGVDAHNGGIVADNGSNGGGGSLIDIYDLSGDCTHPQLLASTPLGLPNGGGAVAGTPIIGHEGAWAPDGLTYYGSDLANAQYYAVDTANSTKPTLITTWKNPFFVTGLNGTVHGLSISDDGNRAYFTSIVTSGFVDFVNLANPAVIQSNGLIIADVSDVQARKANPQIRVIGTLFWKDGAAGQHTIPVKIGSKPYIVYVDEAGSGGNSAAGWQAACAAGLPAWPFSRIIDISDEKNPKIASKLMLETNNPANCDKVLPDLAGLASFTYGTHYCSVDNKSNATTLACGTFNSGIRVFDIRDPLRPKEIAYYNPPGATTASPGSNHVRAGGWVAGGPDWCSAQVHLDAATGSLQTTCQDNGFISLKFTNGVWPFPETTTPPGQQN